MNLNTEIKLEDKKVFIKWILKNRKMKRRESVWILNYLYGHKECLENVHFVEDIPTNSRGMVMSTTDTERVPFRFYDDESTSSDAEKAFHSLRLNPQEDMYIQINFDDKFKCQEYLSVLEDIEFGYSERDRVIEVSEETESLVRMIAASSNRLSLLSEIDNALDSGDEKLFMKLSGMLIDQEEMKAVSFSA